MISKRQRRRNRHRYKVKAVQTLPNHFCLNLNIDVSKLNEVFTGVKSALSKLSEAVSADVERIVFSSTRLLSPNVILSMINLQKISRNETYLGDPSCRFNARSPYIKCAVDPLGNCGDCKHFEVHD